MKPEEIHIKWYVDDESKSIRPYATRINLNNIQTLIDNGIITSVHSLETYLEEKIRQDFITKVSYNWEGRDIAKEIIDLYFTKELKKYG